MSSMNLLRRSHRGIRCWIAHVTVACALLTPSVFVAAAETDSFEQLSAAVGVATAEERAVGLRRYTDSDGLIRTERPETQSIILEVRIGRMALDGEFIFGFRREDGVVLVGLGGLSDLLALAVQVDPDVGVAEGFFLSEDRTFSLSVGAESLSISGQRVSYEEESVELHGDDIYVTLEQLEAWFPVGLDADLLRLVLLVDPQEPLPFQQAQDRQALAGQLAGATNSSQGRENGMRIPYQLVAMPVVNITASGSHSENSAGTSRFGSLSVQSQGDLLGFSSSVNGLVTYRDEDGVDLDTLDILLERHDPRGELLGPLKATNLALGDVLMPSVPLLATARRGRGAYVSNIGRNRVSQANDFVLVGTVPPDWDVELYQDDRLLSIQTVGGDGRYEFSTLSLRPGANEFRIVAYGPNGEMEEQTERVFLGPGLQSAGVLAYELGAVQSSDALLTLDDQALPDEPGFVGRFEYGVSDTFSLIAGGVFGTLGRRSGEGALFAGARASVAGYYTALDVSMEEQGRFALSNEIRTTAMGFDLFASHTQRFNPSLDETNIRSETKLGVGHRPFKLGAVNLGQRVEVTRQNQFSRPTAYIADYQMAMNWRRWTASHSLNIQWFSGGTLPTSVGGTVAVRGRQGDIQYRVQADYSPTQDQLIQNVSLQARQRFGRKVTATLDVDREFNTGVTSFGLDLSWQFDKFSVGFGPTVDTRGDYVVGLTLRTSLLPQDRALKYRFAGAEERSGSTILGVRVFADLDADGAFSLGEPLLSDVIVSGTRKRSEAMTDASGVAWVPNLLPGPQTIVTIDQRTLPDVTYRPAQGHMVVQTRPGVLPVIDYPVLVLGEVDGFVFEAGSTGGVDSTPVSGARVQLIDEQGVVIEQTRTEFDGYYFFSDLKLGTYQVQLAGKSGIETRNVELVDLTAIEPFVSDVMLFVDPVSNPR